MQQEFQEPKNKIIYQYKTLQELRMVSSVTLICQVTMIQVQQCQHFHTSSQDMLWVSLSR